MDVVYTSQRLLGIRDDIENIFNCNSNHPFLDLLHSELQRIEEVIAGIDIKEILSSAIFENIVDEAIDSIGSELYTAPEFDRATEDGDYEDSEEPTRPSLNCRTSQNSARSQFLVNAKVNTLGGKYPRNLDWSKPTHREKIRGPLRSLIICELSRRREVMLEQVSRSKDQPRKKSVAPGAESSGLSMGGVAGTEPTSSKKRAAASPPEDNRSRLKKQYTTDDAFADAVAKVYFDPEWPDLLCLQDCSVASDLFGRLEKILRSHPPRVFSEGRLNAIRVSIGEGVKFRLGSSRYFDYGLHGLMKALEKKQEEDELRFDLEWDVYKS